MPQENKIDKTIDLKGEVCPFPWVKSKKVLANMQAGEVLKIIVDHAPASENIPKYFREEGQEVISVRQTKETEWEIVVKKIK